MDANNPLPAAQAKDLADLLTEAGAVVAGGAALFGTLGFLAAQIGRDAGMDVDPLRWAESGAQWGAVFGLAALWYRASGVE